MSGPLPERVIRGGRWRAGIATVGLTIIGLFAFTTVGAQLDAANAAISLAAGVLFIAMGLIALPAFLRPPRLILTAEALTHVHPYGAPRRMAWTDVARFSTYENWNVRGRGEPVVMYKLNDSAKAPGPMAPIYRAILDRDGALVGSWGREAHDLEQLLETYRKAASRKRPTSPAAQGR